MAPSVLYDMLDFDIDTYLNPFVPHNRLYACPRWLSHWLGYRHEPSKEPHAILQWPITFAATLAGLCLVGGIGNYAPGIREWHPPVIIASLGASAVLEFNTIRSPLAQPRNSVIGNTLAAICGVAMAKLFQHSADFQNIQWVAAAFGCALASWVMSLTNTIHPPGGASAVLAATQPQVIAMGWRFVPIVLLDSVLMVCVALIFNNILRQYPMYWWTPSNTGHQLRQKRRDAKVAEEGRTSDDETDHEKDDGALHKEVSDTSSDRTLRRELSNRVDSVDGMGQISVNQYGIQIPCHLELSAEEIGLLEAMQERLRIHGMPS